MVTRTFFRFRFRFVVFHGRVFFRCRFVVLVPGRDSRTSLFSLCTESYVDRNGAT